MNPRFDVLGFGCVAVDDLIYIAAYPAADAKAEVLAHRRECGGLVGTALVAAARLGAKCAYSAVLSRDELSAFALQRLRTEGIDVSHILHSPKAYPVHSLIVVGNDRATRNIFFDISGQISAPRPFPPAALIRSARVLLVDHLAARDKVRAVRLAHQAGIPVVADFEGDDAPEFPELLGLIDHLILSHNFASRCTGETSPTEILRKLWASDRKVVAVTCGTRGCWYLEAADPKRVRHQPAFAVKAVDTTGCGDTFHGAYAAGLARGWQAAEGIRFAAAAAALKATQPGGQKGIPTYAAVIRFLKARRG